MRHTIHTPRSATIAIAAMLALGSTPALAQETPTTGTTTDPVIILPGPMTPPVAPAPTVTTAPPATQPQANTVSRPVVQDVPPSTTVMTTPVVPEAEAAPVRQPRQASNSSSRAPASRDAAPAPAATVADTGDTLADAPLAGEQDPAAAETEFPVVPMPAAEPVAAEPETTTVVDWAGILALALAGLIPIGFAIAAIMWWRRRSAKVRTAPVAKTAPQQPVRRPEPVRAEPAPAPILDREPAIPVETPAPQPAAATVAERGESALPLPLTTGGAVILPRKLPASFEERDALLKRLIAAKPDRANPFRSPKARAKRARLILQSLNRKFEKVKPRIDLSQYSYIWPHLADNRGSPAAA